MVRRSFLAFAASAVLAACSGETPVPESSAVARDEVRAAEPDPGHIPLAGPQLERPQFTFFAVRPDDRRCPSPYCGGHWVRRVNLPTTICVDGNAAPECYVASLDLSGLGLSKRQEAAVRAGDALFRGGIVGSADPTFAALGVLRATEAWLAPGGPQYAKRPASGTHYRVATNGVVCITHPCPSLTEFVLNDTASADIHGLDLSSAPGTPEQKAAALAATANPGGILAFGVNVKVPSTNAYGGSVELHAYQFYLRVHPMVSSP